MADKSFGVKELNLLNASGTPTVTSPNNLNLNANTVAISTSCTIGNNLTVTGGTSLTNLNTTGISTLRTTTFLAGNTVDVRGNFTVSGISTIPQPADSNPMANWTITNDSSSAYRFTGPGQSGTENNPNIYLVRGHRYIFEHNATSSHPIQIRFANGGAAYTDGVTYSEATNGGQTTDGNNLIFNVQHDAPAQLFYQCTSHGSMVGNIYIVGGPQVISGVVTATSFVGSGANITGVLKNIVEDTSPQLGGNLDCNNKNISLNDSTGVSNNRIKIGTNDDLHLWHNSSTGNSNISNYNGDLYIQGNNGSGTGVNQIAIKSNAAVELNYQGTKKFETTSSGATLTGDLYATSRLLVNTTSAGESNGDEATFANPSGNAGITIRSAVNNECKIYFSEGTSGGSQYRGAINYNQNTNYMAFSANEYERMRITSDGTLQLTYYNQNTGRGRILFGSSAPAFIEGYDTGNAGSGAYLKFGTNGTERSRIDNSGHIFFSEMTSLTASSSNKGINIENNSNYGRMNIHGNSSAGNALGLSFYNNGNNVGTIYYNTSGTSYNTSSDYRLKENEVSISDGITRLKSLKPYRFNFKVDPDKTVDGFFAHEVAPVIPEAVTGEKDAEDMQQIDQAKLVPLLTAALQEAIAEIETLKTKVAALEGS